MIVNRENRPKSPSADFILGMIEHRIRAGEYRNGQRLPTERALAEQFSVSRATIRVALDALEARGYMERAVGCRPRVAWGNDRIAPSGRHSVSVWIASTPGDVGANSALHGIRQSLDDAGLRLVMNAPSQASLDEAIRSEARFLTHIASERDMAGVILWYIGGERNRPYLDAVRSAQIPMVFVDREPPACFSADHAGIDNERAAFEMVRHLLAQGHRRIAHITNPESACTVKNRLSGYRRALEEAGIEFSSELLLMGSFMDAEQSDALRIHADLAERLLSMADPPTAVFAVNDYTALSLLAALRERNVDVPAKMALAGFDDLERWIPGLPVLTTVRQPFERLGMEAVKLLLRRIEAGHDSIYRQVILDTSLIMRASTRGVGMRERQDEALRRPGDRKELGT